MLAARRPDAGELQATCRSTPVLWSVHWSEHCKGGDTFSQTMGSMAVPSVIGWLRLWCWMTWAACQIYRLGELLPQCIAVLLRAFSVLAAIHDVRIASQEIQSHRQPRMESVLAPACIAALMRRSKPIRGQSPDILMCSMKPTPAHAILIHWSLPHTAEARGGLCLLSMFTLTTKLVSPQYCV